MRQVKWIISGAAGRRDNHMIAIGEGRCEGD